MKKHLRTRLLCSTAAASLLVTLGASPSAVATTRLTLMTDFSVGPAHAPIYLAMKKGWFKDAGINLEVSDGKGSTSTINLVGASQADIGYVNVGPMMLAREAGMQVKAIAQFTRKSDMAVIYAADAGINKPADLAGKRIICFSGSVWTPFITPYLKRTGVDPGKAEAVNVDVNAMYPMYVMGRADGIYTSLAHGLPIVDSKRATKWFMASDAGITLPGYGLVVTESLIRKDPQDLKKIVAVLDRAWEYIRDGHEDEAIDALNSERPDARLDHAKGLEELHIWETMIDSPATKGRPIGYQDRNDWVKAIDAQQAAGLIKPGHKPEEFYTNDLL